MPLQRTILTRCQNCGGPFKGKPAYPSQPATRYCSKACVGQAQTRAADRDRGVRFFWPHVDRSVGCWLWAGWRDKDGYGRLSFGKGRAIRAHRFSWELHYGPVPEGLSVLHHCDSPPCVRPDHLFLGDVFDNNADKHGKGRDARGAAHGSRTQPQSMPRGERHGSAKLSNVDIAAIREAPKGGDLIAAQYGVSRSTITRIRSRQRWAHVP